MQWHTYVYIVGHDIELIFAVSILDIIVYMHNSYPPIIFKIKYALGKGGGERNKKFGVICQSQICDNL